MSDVNFATASLGTPDMVALSTSRYELNGGALVDICDRQLIIPVGKDGAGTLVIPGLPFVGLAAGTQARFRFRIQVSPDVGTSDEGAATQIYPYGSTINFDDGSQIGIGGASIDRVTAEAFDLTISCKVGGNEREVEVYLGIADESAMRATPGFIILRNAWIEIVETSGGLTPASQLQRCAEAKAALLQGKPGFKNYLVASTDGSGDFLRIRDAVAAIGPGASETERNRIFVKPGDYTEECSTTTYINPPDYVDIVGLGQPEDVRIIARFPDDQPHQDAIQPFYLMRTCRVANMTVILRNGRYPFHIEGGNSQARAVQVIENVIAIHEGATGWSSPTAFGIGQHAGNHLTLRRVEARSPTSAVGFHNNIGWTRPAYVLIEGCRLLASGPAGQAISAVSAGAEIVSDVDVIDTTINGYVSHVTIFNIPGAALSAHKAKRYEYNIKLNNCSPADWVSTCDVSALALSSVKGTSSAVSISGDAAPVLFGARPDIRRGAADYAGIAYSYHPVDVAAGEFDPGVALAARLGDLSMSPLSLTVAFDGEPEMTISLDADYSPMSNADIIMSLNIKLAAAMDGDTGGRAFALAKPYVNHAPIYQPSREGIALNADAATILKGHIVAWSGRAVRLMTAADTLYMFAGIALEDALAGDRVRFQRTGWTNTLHLLVTGTPSYTVGELFGIGETAGRLTKTKAARALLRVRSVASYGATLEIIGARIGSAASEILDASPSGRSVLTGTAAQGATALGLGTGNSPTFAGLSSTGPVAVAGNLSIHGTPTLDQSDGFTVIKDGAGAIDAILLGSTDASNYYKNNGHYFQSRDSATQFAQITSSGVISSAKIRPGSYTVATVPSGVAGDQIYVSDARKIGEGVGAGTGAIAYYSNGNWRRLSDDSPVVA
jgi:hypothetical protein